MAAPPWCRVSLGLLGRALVSQVGDFLLHKGMSSCHSWCHADPQRQLLGEVKGSLSRGILLSCALASGTA